MLWRSVFRPLLFCLPAETAHELSMHVFALSVRVPGISHCVERACRVDDQRLNAKYFGLNFENPVGLAAGFDKNGLWFPALQRLGFGFVEIGTLTSVEQTGNPKPRLFRLSRDQALINRMGFNNRGSEWAAARLSRQKISGIVGINIGKSKTTELAQAAGDYRKSFDRLFPFASYFTINVSSPNTQGLRDLQNRRDLNLIISELSAANQRLSNSLNIAAKPILLKIAPDLSDEQIDEMAELALENGLDGIIATNTTVNRHGLKTDPQKVERIGTGGLSGAPLTERSRTVVSKLYARLGQRIPIVGCGGIMTPHDAWLMINAGASLIQVYSGFVYGGPRFAYAINRYLLRCLDKAGVQSISDCVGRNWT
ncbi:MAG TPA: quinone-dependent dihydroorotate dehydrogenase [Pirellulaceae bacterium]|nr:quinone-dependent dihydroorotate dehydrogenase [Pirellulaceae bacterium]HMO92931.1 quinone-dependent dihydroorotate dehydrogenase [Pirellulaceae bacterium]HMP71048.1 quinone-dependent dihydroorotate dehydrogenase [Pirellulaceae bacterium]